MELSDHNGERCGNCPGSTRSCPAAGGVPSAGARSPAGADTSEPTAELGSLPSRGAGGARSSRSDKGPWRGSEQWLHLPLLLWGSPYVPCPCSRTWWGRVHLAGLLLHRAPWPLLPEPYDSPQMGRKMHLLLRDSPSRMDTLQAVDLIPPKRDALKFCL